MTDFIPRRGIPLKTQEEKLTFAQSIADAVLGAERAATCPAVWEEIGGNRRFNLHHSSNNWWLHLPDDMIKGWRLTGRYESDEIIRQYLTPFADKFI